MNKEVMGKMFSKYFEGIEKIKGLNVKLISVDVANNFNFNVSVDDGVSYQRDSIVIYLIETVLEFLKIIGYGDFDFDVEIKDELETYHIGQDMYDKIDNTLSKIKQVKMKFGSKHENTIKIDVQHVDTDVEFTDVNNFKITNIVKPIKGYYCYGDNNECDEVSVNDAVEQYLVMLRNRPYDDSDNNYLSIDELIDTYKIFNDGNQVIYVLTEFVRKYESNN